MPKSGTVIDTPNPLDRACIASIANAIAPLDSNVLEELMGSIRVQVLEPKEFLLRVGQPANHEYFLIAGVLRSWIGDAQGSEVTLDFSVGPSILTPAIARVFGGHSRINCQALTHARLAKFEVPKLIALMRSVPIAQCWGDAVLRAELMRRVDREWELAALPAAQRWEIFQKKFPMLDGRVAQHYIASYLGITPVSLSRLKAKIRSEIA